MAVVTHHPVVIIMEGIAMHLLVVEIIFAFTLFELVALVDADRAVVDRIAGGVQGDRAAAAGDEQRSIVIQLPGSQR